MTDKKLVVRAWKAGRKFQEENLRIEKIIFLPASAGHDSFNDDLWELIEDDGGELSKQITNGGDWAKKFDEIINAPIDEYEDVESFHDRPGWEQRELIGEAFGPFSVTTKFPTLLVNVATPVRTYSKGHSGYSYSWGYYNTRWFAGQTPFEIMRHVVKWRNSLAEKAKAKIDAE